MKNQPTYKEIMTMYSIDSLRPKVNLLASNTNQTEFSAILKKCGIDLGDDDKLGNKENWKMLDDEIKKLKLKLGKKWKEPAWIKKESTFFLKKIDDEK